jgi:hypothetical protein
VTVLCELHCRCTKSHSSFGQHAWLLRSREYAEVSSRFFSCHCALVCAGSYSRLVALHSASSGLANWWVARALGACTVHYCEVFHLIRQPCPLHSEVKHFRRARHLLHGPLLLSAPVAQVIHSHCRPLTLTQTMALSSLARLNHDRHYNTIKYVKAVSRRAQVQRQWPWVRGRPCDYPAANTALHV